MKTFIIAAAVAIVYLMLLGVIDERDKEIAALESKRCVSKQGEISYQGWDERGLQCVIHSNVNGRRRVSKSIYLEV